MTRWITVVAALCLIASSCSNSQANRSLDGEETFARFVEAWASGPTTLGRTIAVPERQKLLNSIETLIDFGVVGARAYGVTGVQGQRGTFEGNIRLHFADGGGLRLRGRARVRGSRIVASPSAISTELQGWEPLRIEEVGSVVRGDILTRQGTLAATGPRDARVTSDPTLLPAIALIEDELDFSLSGTKGRRLLAGEPPRLIAESAPKDGEDVKTSLDDVLQSAAAQTLGRSSGALVAIDPNTGGIRALVSNPSPSDPSRSVASSPYSPGSTFKLVTAAAALETGNFGVDKQIPCPDQITAGERLITNFESHDYGPITFEKAFAVSCNTAFAQIGMAIGANRLLGTSRRLGFTTDGSGQASISVPKTRGELAIRSFGADGVLISPLRMGQVASTVAKDGLRRPVGWIDRPNSGVRVLKTSTSSALLTMMEEVVLTGTGQSASVPDAKVAGKTGTADPPRDAPRGTRPDSWFVGLAPSRGTRLVVVVLLPRGGVGGESAAPLFRNFLIATQQQWNS